MAWYLNGRLVHPDDFHKMIVSEKGFHSFIFEVVQVTDAGTWECVAFNRAGEASFTVKLNVIGTGVLGYFMHCVFLQLMYLDFLHEHSEPAEFLIGYS